MKIFIRTDSSIELCTGHVMRCLVLAEELRGRGCEVIFICRKYTGDLIDVIRHERNFKVYTLTGEWGNDAEETKAAIGNAEADWLIIDHYYIDRKWESILRPSVKKIMVIDDLANRSHDCDILLDQNIIIRQNRYDELIPDHCIQLLGPEHSLLDKQFILTKNNMPPRLENRILVSFGGADSQNLTLKTLKAISHLEEEKYFIDVVIGAAFKSREDVQKQCSSIYNVKTYVDCKFMAKLIARSSLAIGAGGISILERSFLGLPAITVSAASNQRPFLEYLHRNKNTYYLGESGDVSEQDISEAISLFFNGKLELLSYAFDQKRDILWSFLQDNSGSR